MNYPDDIRQYDGDPRSPFYSHRWIYRIRYRNDSDEKFLLSGLLTRHQAEDQKSYLKRFYKEVEVIIDDNE